MANYLNNLVLRLGGKAPLVRPRVRGRFEPTEKNSPLPGPHLQNDTTEEITFSNPAPVANPARRNLTSAQPPLHTVFERHLIEKDKYSELIAPSRNSFREEAQPTLPLQIRPQNSAENSAPGKDLFSHTVRSPHSETRSNAKAALMKKPALRDPLFPAQHSKSEIRQSPKSGITDTEDGNSAKHRVPAMARKIEDKPPLQKEILELGITRPQVTPAPSVWKSERRELAEHGSQDVHIVIGRITVQATFPTQPTSPPPIARPAPQLTLEQYLQQRRRQP